MFRIGLVQRVFPKLSGVIVLSPGLSLSMSKDCPCQELSLSRAVLLYNFCPYIGFVLRFVLAEGNCPCLRSKVCPYLGFMSLSKVCPYSLSKVCLCLEFVLV